MLKYIFLFICSYTLSIGYSQSNQDYFESAEYQSYLHETEEKKKLELLKKFLNEYNFAYPKDFLKVLDDQIKSAKSKEIKTQIKNQKVWYLFRSNNYKLAILEGEELVKSNLLFTAFDSLNVNYGMFECYRALGIKDKAINCLKVFDVLDINNRGFEKYSVSKPSLASLYNDLEEFDLAIQETKKELKSIENDINIDYYYVANKLHNIGVFYNKLAKPDSALLFFEKVKTLIETKNVRDANFFNRIIDGNIGVSLVLKKQYKEAIPLLINSSQTKDTATTINNLLELTDAYLSLDKFFQAKKSIQRINNHLSFLTKPKTIARYYWLNSKINEGFNRIDSANYYLHQYISLVDSIFKKERANTLIGKQILYESDKKKAELNAQSKTLVKKSKENYWLTIILAFSGLIVIILIFLSQKIRKDKVLIEQQRQAMGVTLSEKETLLKEIHHRVKNNLQIVSSILEFQSFSIDDDKMKSVTQEGQSRIQSMALIHKRLYESEALSNIQFQDYLEDLSYSLTQVYQKSDKKIAINVEAGDIELGIDTAVPIGLIVNELITNCFKYAFESKEKGEINIVLTTQNQDYRLSVTDNGIGLPQGFDINKTDSLGLDLVLGLTRQLNGNVTYKSEIGTEFIIVFKEAI